MKKIFVSHPYKDDPGVNKEKVNLICKAILKAGYLPISPLHLFSFCEKDLRSEIMDVCFSLIDLCDEVWVFGKSEGCKTERAYALLNRKKVRYFNDDLKVIRW